MTPICDECEAEPADFCLPTEEVGKVVNVCEACMKAIFERIMSGDAVSQESH